MKSWKIYSCLFFSHSNFYPSFTSYYTLTLLLPHTVNIFHTYRLVYSPSPITPSNSIFTLLFLLPLPLQFSPLSLFPPNSRFVPFSLFLSHIPIPPLSSFFSIPFPLLFPHNLTLTLLSFPPSHFLPPLKLRNKGRIFSYLGAYNYVCVRRCQAAWGPGR